MRIIACDGLLEVLKPQLPPWAHPCAPEPCFQGTGTASPSANAQQRIVFSTGQCPAPHGMKTKLLIYWKHYPLMFGALVWLGTALQGPGQKHKSQEDLLTPLLITVSWLHWLPP